MRSDEPSRTAMEVAMGRAAAHGRTGVRGYSDPIAARLLPERDQAALARFEHPVSLRDRLLGQFVRRVGEYMPLRTVAIDEALRAAVAEAKQVVILGAGLDSRAWRMAELSDCIVFEVDHPATQAYKRPRVAALPIASREVRFVSVDFEKDSLEAKLAETGHDRMQPTAWIWEGVVMYLRLRTIEATLRTIAGLSAPGSRLLLHYGAPSLLRWLVGKLLFLVGEPHRSSFTPQHLADLLGRVGFSVLSDEGGADWARRFSDGPLKLASFAASQRLAVSQRGA
jgi:methyltransferase (TIGR00027 family)